MQLAQSRPDLPSVADDSPGLCEYREDPRDLEAVTAAKGLFVALQADNPGLPRQSIADALIAIIFGLTAEASRAHPSMRMKASASELPAALPAFMERLKLEPMTIALDKAAPAYTAFLALPWCMINPDILGSILQAGENDADRRAGGMHYTSVSNVMKVLDPLILEELRLQLERSTDDQLAMLHDRLASLRFLDPACGSGNFLIAAYKSLRRLEAEIMRRLGTAGPSRVNYALFRGIELQPRFRHVAMMATSLARMQVDHELGIVGKGWATLHAGDSLMMDWRDVMPSDPSAETYVIGNPPFKGGTTMSPEQKASIAHVYAGYIKSYGQLDLAAAFFLKAALYGAKDRVEIAFVSTNSICQGSQVSLLWPAIFNQGYRIHFAYRSFKWDDPLDRSAAVTVIVVGLSRNPRRPKALFPEPATRSAQAGRAAVCENINAYLVAGGNVIADKRGQPFGDLAEMPRGNMPIDGGELLLSQDEVEALSLTKAQRDRFIRRICGSAEFIRGQSRYCLWIRDEHLEEALTIAPIRQRIEAVRRMRLASRDAGANEMAKRAHQFRETKIGLKSTIAVAAISSENRPFIPVGLLGKDATVTNRCFALYDAPLWNMALIASRLHWVWIGTVCGRMRTDFSYSNTLGWNTFPVPPLTEKNKADLTRCAEDILLARERYFPATIADMYDPDRMDEEFPLLREAHERNDETLERIYIGRRFRNDTERLEKLFEMYTKMTTEEAAQPKAKRRKGEDGNTIVRVVHNINAYLVPAENITVSQRSCPFSAVSEMSYGSMPNDGGNLLLTADEAREGVNDRGVNPAFVRPVYGTQEFINGLTRHCVWIRESEYQDASRNEWLKDRFDAVKAKRLSSGRTSTSALAAVSYRFGEVRQSGDEITLIVARTSSESREYLPVALLPAGAIVTEAFAIFNGPVWNLALIASRLHLSWARAVCGQLETRIRYSNTLGWNTFPVPPLTEKNKADLTRCAEDILLARERYFPATIADMYDPDRMDEEFPLLREAHERNDETLERIYIGRRFRNDTERLEKLFEMYTKMTADEAAQPKAKRRKGEV